jgi:hypothetical protein
MYLQFKMHLESEELSLTNVCLYTTVERSDHRNKAAICYTIAKSGCSTDPEIPCLGNSVSVGL